VNSATTETERTRPARSELEEQPDFTIVPINNHSREEEILVGIDRR